MPPRRPYLLRWGRFRLELGRRTAILGVLNVTPDSFSDGGLFLDPEAACRQGERLAAEGADILDVGGESTRPFSSPVPAEEEIRRVVPVIAALAPRLSIPIAIDTTKAAVARAALAAGASLINDVSALRFDPEMAAVAADHGVPVVLMHMRGEPRTMQLDTRYADLLGEIRGFLASAVESAVARGIPRERLILDPGIGFGKSAEQNLALIARLAELADLELPLLVGPSRKAFLRRLLQRPGEGEPSPRSPEVEDATLGAVAAAALFGAHIVRVHAVARARALLRVIDALAAAGPDSPTPPPARQRPQP